MMTPRGCKPCKRSKENPNNNIKGASFKNRLKGKAYPIRKYMSLDRLELQNFAIAKILYIIT